jgi:hypothetical protein
MNANRRPLAARFWEKVDKNGPTMPGMATPCWLWTGHINKVSGYGQLCLGGKRGKVEGAHRVAWLVQRGPLPENEDICHD